MTATVRIPTPLRNLTGGQSTVDAEGSTVTEVLKAVDATHPGIGERVFDDAGEIRRFVNVFVEDEDVRHADGQNTTVPEGATVSIIPAVAGG